MPFANDFSLHLSSWRRATALALAVISLASLLAGCAPTRRLKDAVGATPPASSPTMAPTVAPPTAALPTAIPTTVPAATAPFAPLSPLSTPTAVGAGMESLRAKIEILWPHAGAAVRDARLANLTAYLIVGANDSPPCAWEPQVKLWRALNAEPARVVAVGQKRMLREGGRSYPVWDFNDVDVSDMQDPINRLAFFVSVDDMEVNHNIWMHAVDARTLFPQPDIPKQVTSRKPSAVDARIEVVWPHGDLPVKEASAVNVTVYLFDMGTMNAFARDVDWKPVVRLHMALGSDAERAGAGNAIGVSRVITTTGGLSFLAWDFNDIDVRAAQDPLNRIFVWATVDDVPTHSNIWVHGADARTISPETDVLNSCR